MFNYPICRDLRHKYGELDVDVSEHRYFIELRDGDKCRMQKQRNNSPNRTLTSETKLPKDSSHVRDKT